MYRELLINRNKGPDAPEAPDSTLESPAAPQVEQTCFVLHLRPEVSAVPTEVRLRRALKALLRIFAFRVVDITEIDETHHQHERGIAESLED